MGSFFHSTCQGAEYILELYIGIQIQINQLIILIEKLSPLPGFEPRTSQVPSRCATNWAIQDTTDPLCFNSFYSGEMLHWYAIRLAGCRPRRRMLTAPGLKFKFKFKFNNLFFSIIIEHTWYSLLRRDTKAEKLKETQLFLSKTIFIGCMSKCRNLKIFEIYWSNIEASLNQWTSCNQCKS